MYKSYDKDKDYTPLIGDAVKRGDMASAAMLEAQRNRKIQGEGLNYEQTNQYAQYLPVTKNGTFQGYGADKLTNPSAIGYNVNPDIQNAAFENMQQEQLKAQVNVKNAASFLQQKRPEYQSPYGNQIGSLIKEILGMAPFDYDPESDMKYQQLRKLYAKEGNRAAEDTIGMIAGRTGGMMNSYAASAASQQQQIYAQKVTELLPELEQMAYERYMNELKMKQGNLDMLQGLENTAYNRYQDDVSSFERDRAFGYDVYQDERNYGYDVSRDSVRDSQWQLEHQRTLAMDEYNKGMDKEEFDWKKETDERDFNAKQNAEQNDYSLAWAKYWEDKRVNDAKLAEDGGSKTDNEVEAEGTTGSPAKPYTVDAAMKQIIADGLSNTRNAQDAYNFVTSWLEKNAHLLTPEVAEAIAAKYDMEPKDKN